MTSFRPMRLLLALLAIVAATATPARADLPPVQHVFVIVLENQDQAATFGPGSAAPYLARTLTAQGQYLPSYHGVAHLSYPNYIAMVSGQGANVLGQADCQVYSDVVPGTRGPDGQAMGLGCIYPSWVKTVADQLDAKGLTARSYVEDLEKGTPSTCRHPVPGHTDPTQSARANDGYAARHNPFVYFHSLLDSGACARDDVPLTQLAPDLAAGTAPSYSLIVPNLCHDGHDAPCKTGEPGGLKSADAELRKLVPTITASRAYKSGGLIVVTFDESEHGAAACCNEPQFLNTPNNGGLSFGRGGGKVGAVLLSPYIKPGTVNDTPYNHFSLLRSIEDLFGLGHLGYAAQAGLKPFGADVFDGPRCFNLPLPTAPGGRFGRGTLIAGAQVRAHRLELTAAHSASARIRVGHRQIGPRRLTACASYSVRLPSGHGAVTVRVRAGSGYEQRRLPF
ncbi:MAG: phosphoesterase [Solirubrobacterales bacterium]|nr:phosphoesterase [Solirubrobacterales bacterium]